MQPLYRFKLNEDTGEIERVEIPIYSLRTMNVLYKRGVYRYKLNGSYRDVRTNNIDKFVNGSVHSFDSDINHARKIIVDEFAKRYEKACKESEKYGSLLKKLGEHK